MEDEVDEVEEVRGTMCRMSRPPLGRVDTIHPIPISPPLVLTPQETKNPLASHPELGKDNEHDVKWFLIIRRGFSQRQCLGACLANILRNMPCKQNILKPKAHIPARLSQHRYLVVGWHRFHL
jgi:hypothetical protein